MDTLSIGKLAGGSGMGIEAIRYFERKGLLEKPAQTESGYRQYTPEAASKARFIRHAKALGFWLKEIAELLSLNLTALELSNVLVNGRDVVLDETADGSYCRIYRDEQGRLRGMPSAEDIARPVNTRSKFSAQGVLRAKTRSPSLIASPVRRAK